jgi:hypothetical protein
MTTPSPGGYNASQSYPAPGSAASNAPSVSTSDTNAYGATTNGQNPGVSRTSMLYDNRMIPGSGGDGVQGYGGPATASGEGGGSAAAFRMADNGVPSTVYGAPAGNGKPQTLGDMLNWLITAPPDQLVPLQQQLMQGGFLDPNKSTFVSGQANEGDETYNAYSKLLIAAWRNGTDFQSVLNQRVQDQTGKPWIDAYNAKVEKSTEPITSTDTSSSTMLTDPTTAQGVLYKAMQSELHRGPTQDEIAQFTNMLQSTENANPNVTNSTSTRDPLTGITTRSGSNSKTGIDSYRFPEYAALNYAHTGDRGVEANTNKVAIDYMQAAVDATRPAGGADLSATHGGA